MRAGRLTRRADRGGRPQTNPAARGSVGDLSPFRKAGAVGVILAWTDISTLTGAEVDQTAGLLTLRGRGPFGLYGSPTRGPWNCDAMSNNGYADTRALHNPLGLLAELTHRCPLHCLYCSNPIEMRKAADDLVTRRFLLPDDAKRLVSEAEKNGIRHAP